MPNYQYKSRDINGELVTGTLEAASAESVAAHLSGRDLIPLDIKVIIESTSRMMSADQLFKKTVNIEELIIFSRQMYSLNKAGVPIIRALRGLVDSVTNSSFSKVLTAVSDSLESGVDLATSLHQHPGVFSELYVSVIHVGENTGRLDLAFKQVASYLELERDTKKRIGAATRYPVFVLAAIVIAVIVINVLVVPAFAKLFASFRAELPWQTQVLISSSDFILNNWPWLIAITVGFILGCRYYIGTTTGRLHWDRVKLRLPLIGIIYERITLGRFARTYAMVARAGMPVIQSLSIVANALGNAYVSAKILEMRSSIQRGEGLSRTAKNSGLFSPLVLQMIAVGEETGSVDDLLDEVADFYEQEVDYDLKRLADKIEPILLIVIAGMVLILALGVFLPMWDLSSVIQR